MRFSKTVLISLLTGAKSPPQCCMISGFSITWSLRESFENHHRRIPRELSESHVPQGKITPFFLDPSFFPLLLLLSLIHFFMIFLFVALVSVLRRRAVLICFIWFYRLVILSNWSLDYLVASELCLQAKVSPAEKGGGEVSYLYFCRAQRDIFVICLLRG